MKPYILRTLAGAGALAVMLSACDENSWNEHELDGFTEDNDNNVISNKKSIEYTLTEADYKSIADSKVNKALAEAEGLANELKAVGTQFYFTEKIQPNDYVPAFLGSTSFADYTLSDGSSILLTYNMGNAAVAEAAALATDALLYTVSDEEYQEIWGSENDYIAAFAPSHTAASELPSILLNGIPDAEEGQWAVVTYNTTDNDPVFTATPTPPEPGFQLSSVLGTAAVGDEVTVNGYVAAVSTNGCILADASGSMFVYNPAELASLAIGDQIVLSGTITSYNKGLQVAAGSTYEKVGTQEVTYPEPTVFTGADLDQFITRTTDEGPVFAEFTGAVKVNGNNINIVVEGSEKAQGSAYFTPDALKALLTDGATVTVRGYIIAIAGGRYCSTVVTSVDGKGIPAALAAAPTSVLKVASDKVSAVYSYDGSRWTLQANYPALSHADYQAMNQKYDNLSNELPEEYLPLWINRTYPYAQKDDTKYVVYFYYANSATNSRCMPFIYNGSEWVVNTGVTTESAQFVRTQGKWMYDPNVEITLPAGKSQPLSSTYFQACVDWVKENVPDGDKYVTTYGNNDYYTGASAYQGNVDLRASKAREQYSAAYEGMTDEEVTETMKKRFAFEVMPAVLGQLHPDAAPLPGFDVIYTINFVVYTGTSSNETIKFKVTGKGQFEFVECTWWTEQPQP